MHEDYAIMMEELKNRVNSNFEQIANLLDQMKDYTDKMQGTISILLEKEKNVPS